MNSLQKMGLRIKNARENASMSQEELARLTGYINRSSIAKIESGLIDLTNSKILELSSALNVTPSYIAGWEDTSINIKPKSNLIYEDEDFSIYSASRKMEDDQKDSLKQALIICTSPIDDRPSREEILSWLNEHVRIAAFDGSNYENRDDESLYRLYMELKDEQERH